MKNGILDLSKLMPGSGKNGRIKKSDVEAYLAGMTASTANPTLSQLTVTSQGGDLVVELGRTRYGMWKAMVAVVLNSFLIFPGEDLLKLNHFTHCFV